MNVRGEISRCQQQIIADTKARVETAYDLKRLEENWVAERQQRHKNIDALDASIAYEIRKMEWLNTKLQQNSEPSKE